MTTILFIRTFLPPNNKTEVSGYIDLADRMKTEDFKPYFMKKKPLIPRQTDLSFYNWEASICVLNNSPNFRSDANSAEGIQIRNNRDRKVINVNPEAIVPGDGTSREEIQCDDYTQVVFFDHMTRRRH